MTPRVLAFVSPHLCTLCRRPRSEHRAGCPVRLTPTQVRANLRSTLRRSAHRPHAAHPFGIGLDLEVSSR